MGMRFGPRFGPRFGLGESIAYSMDAVSGKAVPSSATEWAAFLASIGSTLAVPNHLWLMQESSGSTADTIDGKALTVSNATYAKAITGWSRTAIGGNGAAVTGSLTSASMVNTATTSYLVLLYARFDPSPTAVRALATYGSPAVQLPAATNKVRLREGASLVDSTNVHNGTVHPFLFAFNVTATTVKLYTDLEKLSVTYSASSGSVLTLQTSSTSDATLSDFLYGAAWDGAAGEISDATAKNLITGLGYSPPWT